MMLSPRIWPEKKINKKKKTVGNAKAKSWRCVNKIQGLNHFVWIKCILAENSTAVGKENEKASNSISFSYANISMNVHGRLLYCIQLWRVVTADHFIFFCRQAEIISTGWVSLWWAASLNKPQQIYSSWTSNIFLDPLLYKLAFL